MKYLYAGMPLIVKIKLAIDAQINMDKFPNNYTEQKKAGNQNTNGIIALANL